MTKTFDDHWCAYECFEDCETWVRGDHYSIEHDELPGHALDPLEEPNGLIMVCLTDCKVNVGEESTVQETCDMSDHVCYAITTGRCAHCDGPVEISTEEIFNLVYTEGVK